MPTGAMLRRVEIVGVPGLPDVELTLGPMSALVGPIGSGKSQLLAAIAWLLTGRPRSIVPPGDASMCVSGELSSDSWTGTLSRRPRRRLAFDRRTAYRLPTCSYLRARDRLRRSSGLSGMVAGRLADVAAHRTSDAVVAEALVSVVEACCEECVSGEVLLVEEPELLLTPQAQRYLYRLLRQFADNGNQVLYSTRSPAFVDAAHHDEIVRLDLRGGRRSIWRTHPAALSDAERVRLGAEFDHERSEMFFARAVVLVEGQTERLSLPFVFRARGHDPDAEGIALVEVGGKSNLPLAARLLRQLQIPYVVLFDADRGRASDLLDQTIIEAAGESPTIRLDPDFEAVAGIASHDDKVLHAWERFARGGVAIPSSLASVVDAATWLAGEAGRPEPATTSQRALRSGSRPTHRRPRA